MKKYFFKHQKNIYSISTSPRIRMKYEYLLLKKTSMGGLWKSCFYFVLFFTVHSWVCLFKQCGEMLQYPLVAAEWAVKLRGWALWLAGSSLPYNKQ